MISLAQTMALTQIVAAVGAARAALTGRTVPDESDREAALEECVRYLGDRVEAEIAMHANASLLDSALLLGVSMGAIQVARGVVRCATPGCTHVLDTATCADGVERCLFCALRETLEATKGEVAA